MDNEADEYTAAKARILEVSKLYRLKGKLLGLREAISHASFELIYDKDGDYALSYFLCARRCAREDGYSECKFSDYIIEQNDCVDWDRSPKPISKSIEHHEELWDLFIKRLEELKNENSDRGAN